MITIKNKPRAIFVFLVIAILLFCILIFTNQQTLNPSIPIEPEDPDHIDFTLIYDEPHLWIDESESVNDTFDEDSIVVNLIKATRGESHNYLGHQQIRYDIRDTKGLFLQGVYNGSDPFVNQYIRRDLSVAFQIGNDFVVDDGIPQGYMFWRNEGELQAVFIFIDQDWINQIPAPYYALWSKNMSQNDLLQQKELTFYEVQEGLYTTSVEDNLLWMIHQNPLVGRFVFGTLSIDDYLNLRNTGKAEGETFITMT